MTESERVQRAFDVLAAIKRSVDQAHHLAARAIQETTRDRDLADDLRAVRRGFAEPDPDDVVAFHKLCHQLVDERETLAKELEDIRELLGTVNSEPEAGKRDEGEGARGKTTS